ncbi:hypothetical protein BDD12DRAFT_900659 [Trichophaea hybrida]|nr:hypothetical protein BDD12DRAFT_900659 [Trichophaea hybrida]
MTELADEGLYEETEQNEKSERDDNEGEDDSKSENVSGNENSEDDEEMWRKRTRNLSAAQVPDDDIRHNVIVVAPRC